MLLLSEKGVCGASVVGEAALEDVVDDPTTGIDSGFKAGLPVRV